MNANETPHRKYTSEMYVYLSGKKSNFIADLGVSFKLIRNDYYDVKYRGSLLGGLGYANPALMIGSGVDYDLANNDLASVYKDQINANKDKTRFIHLILKEQSGEVEYADNPEISLTVN